MKKNIVRNNKLANLLKNLKIAKNKKTRNATKRRRGVAMGPVATVNTAPVAIGNSVRGSAINSTRGRNGAVVVGRDFCFTPTGTGSIATWTNTGGTPLTPAAFVDSKIRSYLQLYQKYRWRRCVVHFITSSPTSSTGDVMFYHGKNRNSVFLNQTSTMLLPFVMSDPDSVIGPQWTNHSTELKMQGTWKSCDYGMSADTNDYADGEVFLLSKTSTTDSPGYVLMDYEIEFAEEQLSPRLLTLPQARIQYSQVNLGRATTATTIGTAVDAVKIGNDLSGSTSVNPTGATPGDVYKIIIDITNSVSGSWVNVTSSTLMRLLFGAGTLSLTPIDGTTIYAIFNGTSFLFYSNAEAAFTGGDEIQYNTTATISYNLQVWMSCIGSVSTINLNPNY
jgi:hypothetical protein